MNLRLLHPVLVAPLVLCASGADAGLADDWDRCLSSVLHRADRFTRPEPFAQYCVGLAYLRGHNVRQDYTQSAAWLGKAAAKNHPGAQAALGYLHENGKGVPADAVRAFDYYRRSADQGNDTGLYYLGRCFAEGIGVKPDRERAQHFYRQAAARGNFEARRELAEMEQAERDAPGALQWAEGMRLYQAQDHAGALRLFLRAAEMGHLKAQVQVGYQHETGRGVRKDEAEAVRWYTKAAIGGDSRAQKNLGRMYEMGAGVREDWTQAAKWYARSAEQGDPDGQDALGRAYQFGIGVPQSRARAISLFRKAAAKGNAEAEYYARWLADPTNNVGFRTEEEHRLVMGNQLRTAGELLGADPAGITFRSSRERTAWLAGLRERVDRSEAISRWQLRQREYDECRRTPGRGCTDPGLRPQ